MVCRWVDYFSEGGRVGSLVLYEFGFAGFPENEIVFPL